MLVSSDSQHRLRKEAPPPTNSRPFYWPTQDSLFPQAEREHQSAFFHRPLSTSLTACGDMALRSQVIGLYREILKYSREVKAPQGGASYFDQAKAEFRKHAQEPSEETIKFLITKAESKLGFLKVIAPRRIGSTAAGKQSFIYRSGEGLVETSATRLKKTAFRDDRIDPDDLARHKRLLEYVPSYFQLYFRLPCLQLICQRPLTVKVVLTSLSVCHFRRQHFIGRDKPLRR